jgi:hypothetical protein
MLLSDLVHQGRVATPTIGHPHGCGEVYATSGKGRQALIEHHMSPRARIAAGAPWPYGGGAAYSKVHRHDQRAVANDHPSTSRPSMPSTTLLCGPRHHLPTRPNVSPYFLHTVSSNTHVPCQRLGVAGLLSARERQIASRTSRPKRLRRLSQERVGRAVSKRVGTCLSPPRTRVSAEALRPPKSGGNMRAKIFPSTFCWTRRRPLSSLSSVSGRPKAPRAWWRGFDIALGLRVFTCETLLGFQTTSLSGFGVFFGISSGGGHGAFLHSVYLWRDAPKDTMPHPGQLLPA